MKELGEFPEKALGTFLGLGKEVMGDPDLLVLFTSGMLLSSRSRPLKGIGMGMAGWFVARRMDIYVSAIASKMKTPVELIDAQI